MGSFVILNIITDWKHFLSSVPVPQPISFKNSDIWDKSCWSWGLRMADVSIPFMMKFVTDNVLLVLKDWLYNQKITLYLQIYMILSFKWAFYSAMFCWLDFYLQLSWRIVFFAPENDCDCLLVVTMVTSLTGSSVPPELSFCHSESQKHLLNLARQCTSSGIHRGTNPWSISTLSIVCLKTKEIFIMVD